jgi:hypothetical protein
MAKRADEKISALLSIMISFFIIGYILTVLTSISYYYVHELGHILFGYLDNSGNILLHGNFPNITITGWIDTPISFIKAPQQTTITGYHIISPYGGMILGLSLVSIITFLIYSRTNRKVRVLILLIPFIFLIFEIVSNFICGPDNWSANALLSCSNNFLDIIRSNVLLFLIFPISYLIYPSVRNVLTSIISKFYS